MEKEESRQWEKIYNMMYNTIPSTLRDEVCEKLIEHFSNNYSISPIETFTNMGEGLKSVREEYVPDMFATMGYAAAYLLCSRDTAIMMCRQYCEISNLKNRIETTYRFIALESYIRDALFDELGFLKPLNKNQNKQGML